MKNYLYCVSEKVDGLIIKGNGAKGINGKKTEVMFYKKLAIVYSGIDGEINTTEESILAHDALIRNFILQNVTVLPFRFGTLLEQNSTEMILSDNYNVFLAKIKELKNKVEISIRGVWEYENIMNIVENSIHNRDIEISDDKIREYLESKMKGYRLKNLLSEYADNEAQKIHNNLVMYAEKGNFAILKTNAMFFNGVYLVDKGKIKEFDAGFRRVQVLFSDYKFLITGPWAPYNFSNFEIGG